MTRLARPGGWVACQEPDAGAALCYPPLPAWDRMREIFRVGHDQLGADLHTGRKLTRFFREAGLDGIEVAAYAPLCPAGHSRRTLLPDLVCTLRPLILGSSLSDEQELAELDREVRAHLADPATLVIAHLLMVAWGRKPSR